MRGVLGLSCRGQPFSSLGGQGGCSLAAVRRRLLAVPSRCSAWALGVWASAVAAHGLENLDSVVQGMDLVALWDVGCGVWDLPKPGVEPALAGGFLTTGHQGSPFLQCKRAQDYDSGGSLADFLLLRKDSLVELHVLSPLATIICLHGSPGVFLKSFHPIKRGSLHEQN